MRSGREHRPPEQGVLAASAASTNSSSRTSEPEKVSDERSSDASEKDTGEDAAVSTPSPDDPAAQLAAVRLELRRISHDLKNSLHAWSLRMDLLARQLGLPESDSNLKQLGRVLERIGGSVESLRSLAHGGRPPGSH